MADSTGNRILVIGDWMIDDYWALGIHRSPTASRIGQQHFRALNPPNSIVQTFAGAGRVASLLCHAKVHSKCPWAIVGMGIWHKSDTDHFRAMFNAEVFRGWTPSQVARGLERAASPNSPDFTDEFPRIQLENFADILDLEDGLHGTTRVVRTNQQTGSSFELISRIDWETPPNRFDGGLRVWVNEENVRRFEERANIRLGALKLTSDNPPAAIVIKDQGKGVISDCVIKWLVERFPDSPWYISTKIFSPSWLRHLRKNTLKLYLIPEIAAKQAVHETAVYSWFVESKRLKTARPTNEALLAIDSLRSKVLAHQNDVRVIAFPNGYSLLACHITAGPEELNEVKEAVFQPVSEPVPFNRNAAMASACFPALIANVLQDPGIALRQLLENSIRFTHQFNECEARWFRTSNEAAGIPPEATPITIPIQPEREIRGVSAFPTSLIVPLPWNTEIDRWKSALNRTGVITDGNGNSRIELWRAMTEVDSYVCCVQSKRQRLARVVQEIRSFALGQPTSNMAGLLIARPGSGKTALVRSLAKSLGMRMLDFNITQLNTRADLFACFDEILTTQAQEQSSRMLVFFDEINALLENQHVYDAFLSPLESGVYSRSGKKYALRPCVWLFAGTAMPTENTGIPYDKGRKASDFESRLTMQKIDLTEAHELGERTENVYRGVSMIRSCWPDVTQVSVSVLDFFFQLSDVVPRELFRIVQRFEGVQYGRVSLANIPRDIIATRFRSTLGMNSPPNGQEEWVDIE